MNQQDQINQEFKEAIVKLERHAQISNEEVGKIKVSIEGIEKNLEWVMFLVKSTLVASIGSIVATIINILH